MAFKLKNESVKKIIGELRKASKTHAGQADRLEKIMSSPNKQKKEYPKDYTEEDIKFLEEQNEDVVRYEDLDEKGKAIWRTQGKPVPKTRRKGSMRDLIKNKKK